MAAIMRFAMFLSLLIAEVGALNKSDTSSLSTSKKLSVEGNQSITYRDQEVKHYTANHELKPTDMTFTDETYNDANNASTVTPSGDNVTTSAPSRSYCSTLHISSSIFVGVVGLLGIVGNSVSIRILVQIKTSLSTSLLLSALGVEDCLFLVTMVTLYPVYQLLVTWRVQYKVLLYIARYLIISILDFPL